MRGLRDAECISFESAKKLFPSGLNLILETVNFNLLTRIIVARTRDRRVGGGGWKLVMHAPSPTATLGH